MNSLITLVRTLGAPRVSAIGAVAVLVLGMAVFGYIRASTPAMRPLFTDLTFDDSSAIVRELDSRSVTYELRAEGAVILVPANEVLSLRMALAENRLPAGGSVGYEIFDSGEGLGATSFVQNLNHLRALEGELSRTIRTIDRVRSARVHLVLPERKLFESEKAEPSASIALRLRGALSSGQIRAIQHLVASAVKDLKPGRVSVVNDKGELLASGTGDDAQNYASSLEERRIGLEERLKRQVEAIVTSVVGPGNARVQVSAEIDTSRVTNTSDIYDPDGRVLRSSQSREEESTSQDSRGAEGVSVGNELPGGAAAGGSQREGSQDNATTTEEITNYEISKRTTTEIREAGGIKRLSVAVLVDGLYSESAGGQPTYAPRSSEQIQQITTLVRTAIGFDSERGDTVEVVNLQFAPEAKPQQFSDGAGAGLGLTTSDYLRIVEMVMLAFIGLVLILFVIRPLLRRILSSEGSTPFQLAAPAAQLEADGGEPALTSAAGEPGGQALPSPAPAPAPPKAKVDEVLDIAKITGEIQENSIRKVADLVKGNPDEAVAIMRQWMNAEAR